MSMSIQAKLETNLKTLFLSSMSSNYLDQARESIDAKHSYEEYLYNLTEKEVLQRFNKRIEHILQQAKFPKKKTLTDFDFNSSDFNRLVAIELSKGQFLNEYINIIFFGSPGTGKTHLALAIGRELCLKGIKVIFFTGCSLVQELVKAKNNLTLTNYFKKLTAYDLVIIDELGYIPFKREEADLLFQFISDRYEKKSILITTNLSFSEWDKVFQDPMVTTATVDRLIHFSKVFHFKKEISYRVEQAKKNLPQNKKETKKPIANVTN